MCGFRSVHYYQQFTLILCIMSGSLFQKKAAHMARKPTRAPAKRKQPAAVETSESIEEQTRAFLKSGNKIDVIQSGVSGQPSMVVNRHIKLGNNTAAPGVARR